MGWSGGSSLMGDVIKTLQRYVKDAGQRQLIYEELISAFEMEDADTLEECLGDDPAYDLAFSTLYPDEEE